MPRTLRSLWFSLGAVTLCALVVFGYFALRISRFAPALPVAITLTPGVVVKGEMPGNEGTSYRVSLKEGQLLHLVAEQYGADVALTLIEPAGRELFRVDSPIGNEKAEHLFFVAPAKGNYWVKVEDGSGGKYAGKFLVRIGELRRATEKDRKNAEAEKAFFNGEAWAGQGLFQEAEASYRVATDRWRELGNRVRQADAFCKLGEVRFKFYDWRGADEAYRQCEALRSAVGDQAGTAEALLWRAYANERLGRLLEAEHLFRQELQLRMILQDPAKQVSALYNLARIEQLSGKVEAALRHFNQVIEACKASRNETLQSNALNGRGGVYASMGKVDLALDDYEQALNLLDRGRSPKEKASLLTQQATIYARHGQLEKATGLVKEALRLRKEACDMAGEGVTLNALGSIYFKAERFDDARDAFQQAVQIFESEQDQEKQIKAMANLGQVHAIQGRPEMALRIFNDALPLAREGGNKPAEAALLYGMAYAEGKKGSLLTGRARIEEAIEVMEGLRSATDRNDLRMSYFAKREDYYSLKISLLMDLHSLRPQAGEDLEAFQTSERARARGLYEALANRADERTAASRNPGLLAHHRRLRVEINKLDQQRRRLSLPALERRRIETRLRELLGEKEEVEAGIHAQDHRTDIAVLLPSLSLWEIQNRTLDRDTLLLEYYLGDERSFLWAVSPTLFRSYELKCLGLRGLAQRVYNSLARSAPPTEHNKTDPENLDRLSRCLLGPIADQLGENRIVVVAHDEVQKIPFSVLPGLTVETTEKRQPLSLRHEVIHLPSISVLAMLRKQREHRPLPSVFLALVADPIYGLGDDRLSRDASRSVLRRGSVNGPEPYDFSRLRSSGEEAREIRILARGRAVEVGLGFKATRDWVIKGPVKNARIVHFATHGLLNEDHPELSGLALSQLDPQGRRLDGLLRAHEIEDLNLKADLVVLSACQTALGKDVRGEGLVGLTQAFLAGGASSLLVSLWKVDDRATAFLMKRFYRALIAEGLPPAAALRQAQMQMQRDSDWQDPFYWSGFVLQGDWRPRNNLQTPATKSF